MTNTKLLALALFLAVCAGCTGAPTETDTQRSIGTVKTATSGTTATETGGGGSITTTGGDTRPRIATTSTTSTASQTTQTTDSTTTH